MVANDLTIDKFIPERADSSLFETLEELLKMKESR
jgi:hypothetical protein